MIQIYGGLKIEKRLRSKEREESKIRGGVDRKEYLCHAKNSTFGDLAQ